MYATLLTKIETILTGITRVKLVSMYPRTDFNVFPAVTVNPAGVENSFDTVAENMKVYRFDIDVIVGINEALTQEVAYTTTMPNVIDDIITAFDNAWDNGTSTEGHRIWQKIDLAESWQTVNQTDGIMLYAPLTLEVKVITNVA